MIAKVKTKKFLVASLCCAVALLSFCGGLYLYHQPLFQATAHFLIYRSPMEPSDLVFVLGGDEYRRIEKAARLYKQGFAPRILIALPATITTEMPHHDLLRNEKKTLQAVIDYHQIPGRAVQWSPTAFYSTYEELRFLVGWMTRHQFDSAIIVPGLFQSRRAKWTADQLFAEDIQIVIAPAEEDRFNPQTWWKSMRGFIMVENECMKNLYYLIKHN